MEGTNKNTAKQKTYDPVISVIVEGIKKLFRLQKTLYRIESDPERKKQHLKNLHEAQKDLSQIVAVLDIVKRESIESITVKTATGFYDCSQLEPSELSDSELADLIIDFKDNLK
nr:hypothetical protein [uncultured Draconibacterium sp.]